MGVFRYFIKLREDKSPKPNRDGKWWRITREEAESWDNVGGVLADDIVVVDFDKEKEAEAFLNLAKKEGLKTLAVKTDRGIHFYFKHVKKDGLKSGSHLLNCIGLEEDLKVGDKSCYAMVKRQGVWRERLYGDENNLEEIPFYLHSAKHLTGGEGSPLFLLKEGEGRNSNLSAFKLTLNSKGLNTNQINTCLDLINSYILAEPLEEKELENLKRDESESEVFKESFGKAKSENFTEEKKREDRTSIYEFLAKKLVEKYHFKQEITQAKENFFYIYKDGFYKLFINDDEFLRLAFKEAEAEGLKISKAELDYKIKPLITYYAPAFEKSEIEGREVKYLALGNKMLKFNLRAERAEGLVEFVENTPEIFCTAKIDVNLNPKADTREVERFFNDISNGDKDIKRLLLQMVGYCLLPVNFFHKSFVLIGSGGNGKSTLLGLISALFNQRNISNVSLFDLENNRFATANLKDKLINMCDDLEFNIFDNPKNLKNITSGDTISAEFKRMTAFSFRPFCKLIFTANEAPLFREQTEGLRSRLIFIPFNKTFKKNGNTQDFNFLSRLTTKENLEALLFLGIHALCDLLKEGQFNECRASQKLKGESLNEADPVRNFCIEWELEKGLSLEGVGVVDLYRQYTSYCLKNGIRRIESRISFTRRVKNLYLGLDTKRVFEKNIKTTKFYFTGEINYLADFTEEEEEGREKEEEEAEKNEEDMREEEKKSEKKERGRLVKMDVLERQEKRREELREEAEEFFKSYIEERGLQKVEEFEYFKMIINCFVNKNEGKTGVDKTITTGFLIDYLNRNGVLQKNEKTGERVWLLPSA